MEPEGSLPCLQWTLCNIPEEIRNRNTSQLRLHGLVKLQHAANRSPN